MALLPAARLQPRLKSICMARMRMAPSVSGLMVKPPLTSRMPRQGRGRSAPKGAQVRGQETGNARRACRQLRLQCTGR